MMTTENQQTNNNGDPAADIEAATTVTGATSNDALSTITKKGPAKRVALGFEKIDYTVKLKNGSTKQILTNVTGAVAPGEVLAIMG